MFCFLYPRFLLGNILVSLINSYFFYKNHQISSGTPPQHLDRCSLAEDLPYFLFLPVSLAAFSSFSSAIFAFHTQIANSFPAPKYLHLILSVSDSALFFVLNNLICYTRILKSGHINRPYGLT